MLEKKRKVFIYLLIILLTLSIGSCPTDDVVEEGEYRPMLAGDKTLSAKFYNFLTSNSAETLEECNNMGVDNIFLFEKYIDNSTFQSEIQKYDMKVFAITQIFFCDKGDFASTFNTYFLSNPSILENDETADDRPKDGWLRMVCPNNNAYRTARVDSIKAMVQDVVTNSNKLDGISIDFIRYYTYWEPIDLASDGSSLKDSCFDNNCITKFNVTEYIDVEDDRTTLAGIDDYSDRADWIQAHYQDAWTQFKCDTITSMVEAIVAGVKEIKPNMLFNLHGVPWKSDDFNGAIKSIIGQDYSELSNSLDYISPMCYTNFLDQEPEWINSLAIDIDGQASCDIIPCMQVNNWTSSVDPNGFITYPEKDIPISTFENCIKESIKDPTFGVMLWPWETLDSSQKKVVKKYF